MYKNKTASLLHTSPLILRGQIAFLSKHGATWFWGHFLTASLFVSLRWIDNSENLALLTLWYGAIIMLGVMRWIFDQSFFPDQNYTTEELKNFAQHYLLYSTLTSTLWGISGIVLFSQNTLTQALHLILLTGVVISTLPMLTLSRFALYIQIGVILLPITLNLLLLADSQQQALGLGIMLMAGLLISASQALTNLLNDLNATQIRMEEQAHTDQVTQMPNRRFFDQAFKTEWRRMARESKMISLLMIDVDHFKRYNDKHGHHAGDQCLLTVASCIKSVARRASDIVARHGGEEFVVLLPDTSIEDANEIAERLRKNVEDQRILHADGALPRIVTVSIGVSCCAPPPPAARLNKTQDEPILYPAMLLNAADRALYRAKRNGRNLVEREFCGQTHATVTPLLSNASNNHAVIHAA